MTKIKEKYPYVNRVYVRAEYPYIDDSYRTFLLEDYEETYFPEHMIKSGKASYVERNYYMIDKSEICVFYYSPDYTPPRRKISLHSLTDYQPKSGTKTAYDYEKKKGKTIINLEKSEPNFLMLKVKRDSLEKISE